MDGKKFEALNQLGFFSLWQVTLFLVGKKVPDFTKPIFMTSSGKKSD